MNVPSPALDAVPHCGYPPVPDQTAIVEHLDEAAADIDAARPQIELPAWSQTLERYEPAS